MSKQVDEKIKQAFENARVAPFGWYKNLNNLEKEVLEIFEEQQQKLQELENDVIGYLNNYDIVKFLEQNNVKYDSWLKNQFFKLVGDIRTEIIMKFSKFAELTKEMEKGRQKWVGKCTVCERDFESTEYFTGACPSCFNKLSDAQNLFLRIALKLQQKGHEYYEKGDKQKTAIFWEIESVIKATVRSSVKVDREGLSETWKPWEKQRYVDLEA
jgi:hypothetical protein